MLVKNFMVPKGKVVSCLPSDTLETVMKKMLKHSVGSIVVAENEDDLPIGIITKTDLIAGWDQGMSKDTEARHIMGRTIEAMLESSPVGEAANHFEDTKHRHAFVVNDQNDYVGIVTAYDVAVETARDHKAWPYVNRDALHEKFKVPTPATHVH